MILLLVGAAAAGDVPAAVGLPVVGGPPRAVSGPTWTTGPPTTADVAGRRFELTSTEDGETEVAYVELCVDGTASWDLGARFPRTLGPQTGTVHTTVSSGQWTLVLSSLELRDDATRRSFSLTHDGDGLLLLDGEAWSVADPTGCPDGQTPPSR